ncbi:MAG TPA: tetratricopeptide repeat protein, partial [Proteobacteria bacterium]|nr:tetratricopeptide repeat protein [Pseudomonadota bacterium]
HYLRVAFFPINLCLDYVYPLPGGVFSLPVIILFPVAFLASTILILSSVKSRFLLLGWGWFLLALLPLANLIPQPRLIADRYLYLPLAGFSLVIAFLADQLIIKIRGRYSRLIIPISLALIFIWWGSLVREQNRFWQSPQLLWEDILRVSPRSAAAHNNLGSLYLARGEYGPAGDEFRKALSVQPPEKFQAIVYTNLGIVQWAEGLKAEAVASLKTAARADPTYAPAIYERGLIYYREGNIEAALRAYRRALSLTPYDYMIYDHLATLFASRGEWDESARYARRAVELNPDYAIGFDHLGIIYANQGRGDEARAQWRRALDLEPNLESARRNLAAAEGLEKLKVPKVP